MRGDYVELSIQREAIPDGCGGELEGIAIRVFGEDDTWAEDRGALLILTIYVPNHEPPLAMPMVRATIDHVLAVLELE